MKFTALATPIPSALDQLSALLDKQGDAVLHGRADELPALHQAIQAGLRHLVSTGWRIRSPQDRTLLQALLTRAQTSQTLLARRQQEVQTALDVLGNASPSLREAQNQRLYAPAGRLGAPVLHRQTSLRA